MFIWVNFDINYFELTIINLIFQPTPTSRFLLSYFGAVTSAVSIAVSCFPDPTNIIINIIIIINQALRLVQNLQPPHSLTFSVGM